MGKPSCSHFGLRSRLASPALWLLTALIGFGALALTFGSLTLSPAMLPTAQAAEVMATTRTLFGPEIFARGSAQPTTYTRTFAADRLDGAFTLVIENGDLATGTAGVASALVRLNGTDVAVPNDFKKAVAIIERPVELAADNTL